MNARAKRVPQWNPDSLRGLLSPFPAPPPPLLANFLAYYQLADLDHQIGTLNAGENQLVVHQFSPEIPRAECLLVTGYLDHVGLFSDLIKTLLSQGYRVTTFDLPGQGLSSGPRAEVKSFTEYFSALQAVQAQLPDSELPRLALGQSTGGSAWLDWVRQHGDADFDRFMLLNPLVRPRNWRYLAPVHWFLKRLLDRVKRGRGKGTHNDEFNAFLQHQDSLQSKVIPVAWLNAMVAFKNSIQSMQPVSGEKLWVFQGTEEKTVDAPWNIAQIAEKFPGVRVVRIEGARHHLANETPEYRQRVDDALASFVRTDGAP